MKAALTEMGWQAVRVLIAGDKNWAEGPAVAKLPGEGEPSGPDKSDQRRYYSWQENINNSKSCK